MTNEAQVSKLPEDIFKREAIAESMCKLICSSPAEAISPIVLQGPWGAGKSTHAMRMMEHINKNYAKTHKCIYWNASNCDYAVDPLPFFVANLYSETASNEQKQFSKVGFKLCSSTAWAVSKELVKQAVEKKSGLDLSKLGEVAQQAVEETERLSFLQFKKFIEEAGADKKRIDTAKELLDLARGDRELIIIIDELDRCRPDFALQMIETIKHLFTNEHCKFLLIANKQSLVDSICNIHGLRESNAEIYLNKFIKTTLQLPHIEQGHRRTSDLNSQYFFHLMSTGFKFTRPIGLSELVLALIKNKKLQLREIEKWVRTITNLLNINKINSLENIDGDSLFIIVIISYLIAFDTETAFQFAEKSIKTHELLDRLGIKECDLKITTSYNMPHIDLRRVFDYYLALGSSKEGSFFTSEEEGLPFMQISQAADFLKEWIQYSLFIRSV